MMGEGECGGKENRERERERERDIGNMLRDTVKGRFEGTVMRISLFWAILHKLKAAYCRISSFLALLRLTNFESIPSAMKVSWVSESVAKFVTASTAYL
jgi:hypothetical protein